MVKRTLMGACWGAVCASVSAMSLGSLQGQAVMGRSLQLSVPVTLAAGESGDALCPRVRLRQGEEAVAGVRVSVRPDAMRSDRVLLLIESSTLLTEPYVLLGVTVGCGGQVQSRAYTVLVDLPVLEAPASAQAREADKSPQVGLAALGSGGASRASGEPMSGPLIEDGVSAAHVEAAGHAQAPVAQLAPVARGRPPETEAVSQPPRSGREARRAVTAHAHPVNLHREVAPPELLAAIEAAAPHLALSWAMGEPADPQGQDEALRQRREAARAMWRALNESPEGVVQAQSLAQSLAQSQVQWQEELARAQAAQQAAQQRAVETEEGIYTHPLVLALAALAALGLGTAAVLWRRQLRAQGRGVPRWTLPARGSQTSGAKATVTAPAKDSAPWWTQRPSWLSGKREAAAAPAPVRSRWAALGTKWLKWRRRSPQQDSLLSIFDPPERSQTLSPANQADAAASEQQLQPLFHHSPHTQPPASEPSSDFLHSTLLDGGRSVAAEELLDLQQQVDFFTSLGQLEQAVEVLRAHLADSSEPSPLAYLDLLKLYHELGRREEYEALRAVFNREFHGHAPDFEHFRYSRRGLERYEAALSRIVMLWPKPEVLDVIEQSIFRRDQSEPAEAFDLEAYRELLLLYAIARDRIARDRQEEGSGTDSTLIRALPEGMRPRWGADTVIQPLSAQAAAPFSHRVGAAAASQPSETPAANGAVGEEAVLPSGGLDLDLSLLPQTASQAARDEKKLGRDGSAQADGGTPRAELQVPGSRASDRHGAEETFEARDDGSDGQASTGGLDLELPDWRELGVPDHSAVRGPAAAPASEGAAAPWSLHFAPPGQLQIRKPDEERA